MYNQDEEGKRKGLGKKIWVFGGIIVLAVVIGVAVQTTGKKKSGGEKNQVTAEKYEKPDQELSKKNVASNLSEKSEVSQKQEGQEGQNSVTDQERIIDQEDWEDETVVTEQETQNGSSNQATTGLCVVYRKGWVAMLRDGELHLSKDGKEIWSYPGRCYWFLMMTDEGLFYITGEESSELNYYDFARNETVKLPISYNHGVFPIAFVDGKVYLQMNRDEISNDSDEYKVVEFSISDGEEREILLEDSNGSFSPVFCNGKLYYFQGGSGEGARMLYEGNLDNGNTTILDESTAQDLITDDHSIFYLHCDDTAFNESSMVQLIEMDTPNLQSRVLLEGNYSKVGRPVYADQRHIILYGDEYGKPWIKIYDRTTGQSERLDTQEAEILYFMQGEEKGFYFNACNDYVENGVSYGAAPYHVFYYDYGTKTTEEVGSTEEYAACVVGSQIYYLKWENSRLGCGSVPFGNVAPHNEIPQRMGDAKKAEYILPGSDNRYYEESDLERLTNGELKLARNEIYARHGYVFEAPDLEKHFSSKAWYTPSMEAEEFDQELLNKYEKANLQLILDYEREKGVNQK